MKRVFMILTAALMVLLLAGCSGSKPYEGNITGFSYHYGSYNGGYYAYELNLGVGTVFFFAYGSNGVELDIEHEADIAVFIELAEVINKNHLEKWDGFSKSDDNVLDGYSFSLDVAYDDGRTLSASGYEMYPANYRQVHEELVRILEAVYQ